MDRPEPDRPYLQAAHPHSMIRERAVSSSVMRRFNRSLYISLALACATLTYVEWWFLPEVVILGIIVAGVMFIAFRAEDKWSLSLRAANIVGAGIAIILGLWATYHFLRPQGTLLDYLPPQAAMLVYLGPLVMILIPAKLFRPKHMGDYWSMQLIGLMTVALACALGGNSGLLAFALSYAVTAVWCLTNFHAVLNSNDADYHLAVNTSSTNIPRIGAWAVTAMALAIGLSLATPRNSDAQWGVGGLVPKATIGNTDDKQQIDLNFTGDLEASNEVAFIVRAETGDRQPKLDLPPAQKWRGGSFNFYDQGKWVNRGWPRQNNEANAGDRGFGRGGRMPQPYTNQGFTSHDLPDLGPKQFYLIYPYPLQLRGTFYLASPLWPPTTRIGNYWAGPVITEGPEQQFNWIALRDGETFPAITIRGDRTKVTYRQVTAPTPEPGLSLPIQVDPALRELLKVVVGMKPLKQYSNNLMQQLIATNQLPSLKSWTPETGPIPPDHHEEVIRVLEKYFGTSGAFEYNTQALKRNDLTIDPIEDFLLNTKQGHCNRFATAMALVLRAQGIPARFVLGYEGCESNGDGSYTIRQMHAHSWVECLIRRATSDGSQTWHWLTVDPSPSIERLPVMEFAFAKWLEETMGSLGEFFRTFVMELNAERQDRARSAMAFLSPLEWGPKLIRYLMTPLGWISAIVLTIGLWFLRRRQRKTADSISAIYHQLRINLQKARFVDRKVGVTPRELCRLAEPNIANTEVASALHTIVDCHDETTYAGKSADADELSRVRSALRTVSRYCKQNPRPRKVVQPT